MPRNTDFKATFPAFFNTADSLFIIPLGRHMGKLVAMKHFSLFSKPLPRPPSYFFHYPHCSFSKNVHAVFSGGIGESRGSDSVHQ